MLYPAGIAQREAFVEARRQGLYIVSIDGSSEAPLKGMADAFYQVDPADVPAVEGFIRSYKRSHALDGLLIVGCDLPVSCAAGGALLGTPAISKEAAKLTVDKIAMKRRLRAQGVLVPDFFEVQSGNAVSEILERTGARMIIKPNDNCGARGVSQLKPGGEPEWAFDNAKKNCKSDGKVVLEQYIEGPQISIEGLVCQGNVYVTGFADRNYEYIDRFYPHVIENGATMPTLLSEPDRKAVENEFVKGIHALGIDNSVAKGDMVVGPRGPMVIEIAGRISGGKFASQLVPKSNGVNLLEAAIKMAVGGQVDVLRLEPKFQRGVAVRYMFPEPGVLRTVHGVDEVRRQEGIVEAVIVPSSGDRLSDITCHADRSGWVVAEAASRTEAEARAENAVRQIVFDVDSD